jgi:hypothetical protein
MTARRTTGGARPRPGLTRRQRALYDALTAASKDVGRQLLLIDTYANTVGASDDDRDVVREQLLMGHTHECPDRRM